MKLIHTADWHLGPREFLDSTLANIERLCQIGDERGAQAMIVAGDIFHNRQNLPEATRRLAEVLRPSIKRGMHLILVPGNHDDRAHLNMIAELLQIGDGLSRVHIARNRTQIFEIDDPILGVVQFGALPYPTQEQYLKSRDEIATAGESNQSVSAVVDGLARKLRAKFDPTKRAVFIAHLNVAGVTTSSGHELEIWDDLRLGTESLPDENCVAYIALGHIHLNQAIAGHPIPAHYSGSIERTNLGERDEAERPDKKGALWVEIPQQGNASVERICLDQWATPFYKLRCALEEIPELPAKYPRFAEAFVNCTVTGATEAQRGQISRDLRASCRQLLDCTLEGVEIAPLPTGLAPGEDQAGFAMDYLRERLGDKPEWPELEKRARRLIDAQFNA